MSGLKRMRERVSKTLRALIRRPALLLGNSGGPQMFPGKVFGLAISLSNLHKGSFLCFNFKSV